MQKEQTNAFFNSYQWTYVQQVFRPFQQIHCSQNRTLVTIHRLLSAVLRVVPVLYNLMTMKMMRDDEKIWISATSKVYSLRVRSYIIVNDDYVKNKICGICLILKLLSLCMYITEYQITENSHSSNHLRKPISLHLFVFFLHDLTTLGIQLCYSLKMYKITYWV
jgi:hypothetical protein